MPKRSITDDEIALIKAMLARDMKNKDIQFFFNRPDRPVNSGRISGIAKGIYGGAQDIPAASARKTTEFINKYSAVGAAGVVIVPAVPGVPEKGPMSPEALLDLFEEVGVGLEWRLKPGETDEHECKASFGFKHSHNWLRPMAALANNRGGYLLFGVHDKGKKGDDGADLSYVVCGLKDDELSKTDPVEFTKKVKSIFDPTPRFTIRCIAVGGKSVGVIHVERHPSRPVIATRSENDIKEGDVFFRYSGQSSRIKYSDLRAMLDDRDSRARADILPMVERLLALGPSRAMIADLSAGTLDDGKRAIQIDETLLEKIAFIKEGSFDEVDGAPALRLMGDVTATGAAKTLIKKGVVTRADLNNDFLSQSDAHDPKEYIRFAIEGLSGTWLPLHYYAKQASLTKAALIAFVSGTDAPAERRAAFVGRIANKDAARQTPSAKLTAILEAIKTNATISAPKTSAEAAVLGRALLGLPRDTKIPLKVLLQALASCTERATGAQASVVRRAICRVDEVFFGT